jgi:rare lipoprotein A
MQGLTAAHQWLPLGSMIRVVNLMNGKFLFVQVTDRGPYVNGRILDLSHGAAVRLGMEKGGLAIVQIEVVGERRPDALLPSDLMPAASRARIFRVDAEAARHRPRLLSPFRPFPGDLWTRRGMRRVPSMLAADHTAHAEVAALPLS